MNVRAPAEGHLVLTGWRLVRIGHSRCDEHDGFEYVLAPPDWADVKIRTEIREAAEELAADAKVVKESPLNPPHNPPYADHPEKTVAEVQAIHQEQQDTWNAWRAENVKLSRSFLERLRERGFRALWDDEHDAETGVLDAGVYWGHAHGLTLNYGD